MPALSVRLTGATLVGSSIFGLDSVPVSDVDLRSQVLISLERLQCSAKSSEVCRDNIQSLMAKVVNWESRPYPRVPSEIGRKRLVKSRST
jgi:hypothetical protein